MRTVHAILGLTLLLSVVGFTVAGGEEEYNMEDLNGFWFKYPSVNENSLIEVDFSWGPGLALLHGGFDIDLGAGVLRDRAISSDNEIRSVEKVDEDTFRIVFWFPRGGFEIEWTATFIEPDVLYFEQIGRGLSRPDSLGRENPHYKIDGPDISDPPKSYPNVEE